jgi:hypothetical protein
MFGSWPLTEILLAAFKAFQSEAWWGLWTPGMGNAPRNLWKFAVAYTLRTQPS